MRRFFNRNKNEQPKLEGVESTVSSEDLLRESSNEDDDNITTELSIHPDWSLPREDEYAFRFLNNECPPLKPNQLSLSGINLYKEGNDYRVNAFIRHSLSKNIRLSETTLILLGENNELLGRKLFNLEELGELPPKSSRPWNFVFTSNDLFKQDLPQQGWKLAFEIKQKHSLDLDENWEKSLSQEAKQSLVNLVEQLTPPEKGEVNFMGLQATYADNGDFHVTLLIRNGSDKNITLQQLPLEVTDANSTLIAKGSFNLNDLEVRSNTSKPWTFIFPSSLVCTSKENSDLSQWVAYVPQ